MAEINSKEFITFSESNYLDAIKSGAFSVPCRRFGDMNAPCSDNSLRIYARCGSCPFSNQDNFNYFLRMNEAIGVHTRDQRNSWHIESTVYKPNGQLLGGIRFVDGFIHMTVHKKEKDK